MERHLVNLLFFHLISNAVQAWFMGRNAKKLGFGEIAIIK
jgi:hypothetical protein